MLKHVLRAVVAALALAAFVPAAHAAPSPLVVGEIYTAGGNAGAAFANDYVELFNRGSAAIDLTGWSVQYATAAGSSWSVTPLAGSVEPGKRVLVQLAPGGGGGPALPAADVTGTPNLAVAGGKVAVVRDAVALTCGASAGSCAAAASIADLVGYGTAADFEGAAAAAAPAATTAAVRGAGGCTDTDSNGADFAVDAPTPTNATAAATRCGGTAPGSVGASVPVDVQVEPVLAITLERPSISFGRTIGVDVPAPVSERVTVVSNNATGYSLTVHRAPFVPQDLPLGIAVGSGALTEIPTAAASALVVGASTTRSASGGDVYSTAFGFRALPTVAPGLYTSSVTFTLLSR